MAVQSTAQPGTFRYMNGYKSSLDEVMDSWDHCPQVDCIPTNERDRLRCVALSDVLFAAHGWTYDEWMDALSARIDANRARNAK